MRKSQNLNVFLIQESREPVKNSEISNNKERVKVQYKQSPMRLPTTVYDKHFKIR